MQPLYFCLTLLIFLAQNSNADEVTLSELFNQPTLSTLTQLTQNRQLGFLEPSLQIANYDYGTGPQAPRFVDYGDARDGAFTLVNYAKFSQGGDLSGNIIRLPLNQFRELQVSEFVLETGWTLKPIGNTALIIKSQGQVLVKGIIDCRGGAGAIGSIDPAALSAGGLARCAGFTGGEGGSAAGVSRDGSVGEAPTLLGIAGGGGAEQSVYSNNLAGSGGGGGGYGIGFGETNVSPGLPGDDPPGPPIPPAPGVAGSNHGDDPSIKNLFGGAGGGGGGSYLFGASYASGGGGGAGGGVVLIFAGGNVTFDQGKILVQGGNGGSGTLFSGDGGQGGGGSVFIASSGENLFSFGDILAEPPHNPSINRGGVGAYGRTWLVDRLNTAGYRISPPGNTPVLSPQTPEFHGIMFPNGKVESTTLAGFLESPVIDLKAVRARYLSHQIISLNSSNGTAVLSVRGADSSALVSSLAYTAFSQAEPSPEMRFVQYRLELTNASPVTPLRVSGLSLQFNFATIDNFNYEGGCASLLSSPFLFNQNLFDTGSSNSLDFFWLLLMVPFLLIFFRLKIYLQAEKQAKTFVVHRLLILKPFVAQLWHKRKI